MMWVYHPKQDAKIVDFAEGERLLDSGWYDTPANFPSEKKEIVNNMPEVNLDDHSDLRELPVFGVNQPKRRIKLSQK